MGHATKSKSAIEADRATALQGITAAEAGLNAAKAALGKSKMGAHLAQLDQHHDGISDAAANGLA